MADDLEDITTEFCDTLLIEGKAPPDLSEFKTDVILFDRAGTAIGEWKTLVDFEIELDGIIFKDDLFYGFYFPYPLLWLEFRVGEEVVQRWESPEKAFFIKPWPRAKVTSGKFVGQLHTGDDQGDKKLAYADLGLKLAIFDAWKNFKGEGNSRVYLPLMIKVGNFTNRKDENEEKSAPVAASSSS